MSLPHKILPKGTLVAAESLDKPEIIGIITDIIIDNHPSSELYYKILWDDGTIYELPYFLIREIE